MTTHSHQTLNTLREKGQSLVEVALFLPIFLVIIAGLVEVSNILVTQNSVHNATRVGTRFGSNGGQDEGMVLSVQNAVTDVLDLEEGYWDMWAIRGRVNDAGTDFDEWEFTHIFGDQTTQVFSDVVESEVRQEVLDQLQTNEDGNTPTGIAGDIAFVGMYVGHDIDSVLGLNALEELAGVNSVRSLAVMRGNGTEDVVTDACTAFPIAVDEGIRSINPETSAENRWRSDFDYPTSPEPLYSTFLDHRPEIPFPDAREGYLYNIQNGSSAGGKGWLAWNLCEDDNPALEASLTWPGNSNNHTPDNPNATCIPKGSSQKITRVPGFIEAGDVTDESMHIGDWVAVNSGNGGSSGVKTQLNEHVELGRTLRVIVYNPDDGTGVGGNAAYHITRFAIMRLIGYSLNSGGGDSFILAEFIRWDDSCGQDTNLAP